MQIKKIGVVANTAKQKCVEYTSSLNDWLGKKKVKVLWEEDIADRAGISGGISLEELAQTVDLLVVFGGDGTILRTACSVAMFGVPIVGINLGSFGYLTEVNLNEIISALELILQGKYATEDRMMLDVILSRGKTIICSGAVLNDAVINRGNLSRIVELETQINGQHVTTYKADGLIISTPTGSTAYSLSAGGPIVYPKNNLIIVNPICPHTLTNRPIICPGDYELKVALWSKEKGATLTLDGQKSFRVKSGDVIVIKKSKNITRLVLSPHRSYWEILRSKLGWGGVPSGWGKRRRAQ